MLSADLTDDDKAGLVLTVDDTTTPFAFSGATKGSTGLYSWGLSGLDWSSSTTVTVRLSPPPPDDFPAGTTTTGQVDVGGSVTGNIESVGDADWFLVELEETTRYQIDLEGADTGRGTVSDPTINAVRDAGGNTITGTQNDDSGVGNNARTIFTATASGTHYVVAAAYQSTGTYTLSVIVLGANGASEAHADFPNNNTTSGRVEVGASVTGNTATVSGDDWFRVDLEAGKTYQFDLEGAPTNRGTLPDPLLKFYDGSENQISRNDDIDPDDNLNSQIVYPATATGTYYLSANSTNLDTGTYTLSVRDITPPDDPPDDSGNVPDPVTDLLSNLGQANNLNFAIAVGDFENAQGFTTGSDSYGYFLASINLDVVDTVPKTPADVTVSLWSATSDSPPEPDAPVATLTHSTGTWATGVNTFNAPGGTVLDPGTTYFVVASYSGARAHLSLRPTASGSADDDSTGWSVAGARLTRSRTDLGDWSGQSGEYTKFSVSGAAVHAQGVAEGATDLPADTSTGGVVEVGGVGSRGVIHEPIPTSIDISTTSVPELSTRYELDTDWFAVELEAGRTYRIDMKGAILTSPGPNNYADPELTLLLPQINAIYDADGDYLRNTWGADESSAHHLFRVTFHAHAGGTYYIAASGESFEWGGYELTVILAPASKPAVASEPPGLAPNVPNPFNPSTVIPYRLDTDGPVRLDIYNLLGQRIRTLVDEVQAAGAYRVRWDARDATGRSVATGIYFTRLHHPGGVHIRRMLYLK